MFNRAASAYTTLGFELIGLVVVLVFLGRWVDEHWGWGGWGTIGGVTIAFVGWTIHLYIVVQMLAKQDKSGDTSQE